MPKKRPGIELYSYGIYEPWNRASKDLPKLKKITNKIPIKPDIEFGYIIKIRKAKGSSLTFIINHPEFLNSNGKPAPPFKGKELIPSNNWSFFLGDTVWLPYENKAGNWELITWLDGKEIARKNFELII